MKILCGLLILLACGVWEAKGSLLEFGHLIKNLTGKSAFPNYTSYGCYCGIGGKGQARDATDRCCFQHDCCYEKLSNCNTKTDKYNFTIQDGVITCGKGSWCEERICECDKATAICFRDNLDSYDKKYRFYIDIFCKEPPMQC
ncbi:basic phospholipase A2 Sms-N6-like [Elgaria multicarinata webbii]|uniref:basic phospholipase A2 Sms-N6-like n=1 Tax=Elgaria multicarinata webbii TaxID=159646 RepID=UPI002FCCF892